MSAGQRLERNVVLTGLTSFFTDVSSEMVYPLLQAFVAAVLESRKALLGPVLGVMEGVAESTASLLKVAAGYYSDRMRARKAPAIAGYGLSAGAKALFLLAGFGWYFVLIARFLERVGKGIRTAPRDALISESVPVEQQGRAFGFQRAMDFAGATLGTALLYAVALRLLDPASRTLRDLSAFYWVFGISIAPAALAVVFLFFTRETHPGTGGKPKVRPKPNLDIRRYDRTLRLFFIATIVFTLGNSSNQFLLLRSMNVGHTLPSVILMYLLFNLSSAALSQWFGKLSDRIGRRGLLAAGYTLYGAVYMGFGFVASGSRHLLWFFWIVYGVYYAMTEGVEKALVSELAPADSKATALGLFHTLVGICLLPASVIAGILFAWHPAAPFVFGGFTSLVTVVLLTIGMRSRPA